MSSSSALIVGQVTSSPPRLFWALHVTCRASRVGLWLLWLIPALVRSLPRNRVCQWCANPIAISHTITHRYQRFKAGMSLAVTVCPDDSECRVACIGHADRKSWCREFTDSSWVRKAQGERGWVVPSIHKELTRISDHQVAQPGRLTLGFRQAEQGKYSLILPRGGRYHTQPVDELLGVLARQETGPQRACIW